MNKRIYIKADTHAINALFTANIPSDVIEEIIGQEFETNDRFEIEIMWCGQLVKWIVPPDAIKLIPSEFRSESEQNTKQPPCSKVVSS